MGILEEYGSGLKLLRDKSSSFTTEVKPCTWENLYPNMFVRHLVMTQYELHEAPRETHVYPKGPAAPWYEPKHYYVKRTRDGDRYLGSCDTYDIDDADFIDGVVVKKYRWRLPVEDPYVMLVCVKWRTPPISFIKLDCVVTRDGMEVRFDSPDRKAKNGE